MKRRLYFPETVWITRLTYVGNCRIAGHGGKRRRRAWLRLLVWMQVYREIHDEAELREALWKNR